MDLKKINELNETSGPLFFLVLCALTLGVRLGSLVGNLNQFSGSIILSKPAVIPVDIFSTITHLFSWLIYICIFLSAFAKKSVHLIFAYFFVVLGFILEPPIVNKLGYKSLHVVAILSLILAVILLSKYITNKIDYYKSTTIAKGDNNTDNKINTADR